MPSSVVISPIEPQASQVLLRERLAQLEAALLEARGRVIMSFDRELASLRGWMESLEHFDPTIGLRAMPELVPSFDEGSLQELINEAPLSAASNILPFGYNPLPNGGPEVIIEEPPVDPCLASATLDELNAALAAAFQQVAEK